MIIKKTKDAFLQGCWENVTHIIFIADQVWTGVSIMKISVGVFQKVKNRTTIWPSCTVPGHISEHSLYYHRDSCSSMFLAVLFTIARKWTQPRWLSADKMKKLWMVMKKWYIHTMEFYSGTMKNEHFRRMSWSAIVLNVLPLAQISNACSLISRWLLLLIFVWIGNWVQV